MEADLHRAGRSELGVADDAAEAHFSSSAMSGVLVCALDVMAYTQGMNIIAAAALVATQHDEDQAFRLFAWLMRSHSTLFGGAGLVGARVECRALRLLLEARNPELWRGERTLSDAIEMCASQWMLSLWVGVLPLDGVWEVWRLLLAEGDEALPATSLRVAVALLEAAAPTVARALADDAAAAAECAEVEAGAGGENTYAAVCSAAAGVADIGALVAPVALDAEAVRDARARARAEIDAEEAAKVARRRQPRIESPITTAGVARRSSGQAVGRGLLLVALSGILFSAMAALTRAAAAHGATAAVVVLVSAVVRWSCLVVLLCARREPLAASAAASAPHTAALRPRLDRLLVRGLLLRRDGGGRCHRHLLHEPGVAGPARPRRPARAARPFRLRGHRPRPRRRHPGRAPRLCIRRRRRRVARRRAGDRALRLDFPRRRVHRDAQSGTRRRRAARAGRACLRRLRRRRLARPSPDPWAGHRRRGGRPSPPPTTAVPLASSTASGMGAAHEAEEDGVGVGLLATLNHAACVVDAGRAVVRAGVR